VVYSYNPTANTGLLPLQCLIIANFISIKLCLEEFAGIDVFEVVHLAAIKKIIFNCKILTVLFRALPINF